MLYELKYRVLTKPTWIRNVGACIAFLAGSYLASCLINAAPVTQPDLVAPRGGVVIVAPQPTQDHGPAETLKLDPEAPVHTDPWAFSSL